MEVWVTASQHSGCKDVESSSERLALTLDVWIIGIPLPFPFQKYPEYCLTLE